MLLRSETSRRLQAEIGGESVIEIQANAVLLDIEGTTSPIAYVYDVLFPFARNNARSYLQRCWDDVETLEACDLIAKEAGHGNSYDWLNGEPTREAMLDKCMFEIEKLMDADSKSTGLKMLQGFIWAEAYRSGLLCSQVFDDVPQALSCWKASGYLMAIYSSGSATAQREFFAHTEQGDLSDYFSGFFDTSCGPKREPLSYTKIAKLLDRKESDIVFFSDIVEELDAAKKAGLQTVLLTRPGNPEQANNGHHSIPTFYDIKVLQDEGLESSAVEAL